MIRIATTEDAGEIQKIYAPYVENTAITFEYDVPDVREMRHRIALTLEEYPYLVAVENEKIVGYAYTSSFHGRAAYKHCAEVSIYLDEEHKDKGYGRALYQELEKYLVRQNVNVLYACITETERQDDPRLTDGSIRFHEKMGYVTVGRHNLCGYKFDKWYSVIWMEKVIADRQERPEPFVPFGEL